MKGFSGVRGGNCTPLLVVICLTDGYISRHRSEGEYMLSFVVVGNAQIDVDDHASAVGRCSSEMVHEEMC